MTFGIVTPLASQLMYGSQKLWKHSGRPLVTFLGEGAKLHEHTAAQATTCQPSTHGVATYLFADKRRGLGRLPCVRLLTIVPVQGQEILVKQGMTEKRSVEIGSRKRSSFSTAIGVERAPLHIG